MTKKLLLLHGPNLNLLGKRDHTLYGSLTLAEIEAMSREEAARKGFQLLTFQSNHEGALLDYLQQESSQSVGIIINPGALTHYSYALHDALLDTKLPIVEVHLSAISQREKWRSHSVIKPICIKFIAGKKAAGYNEAIQFLATYIHEHN